MEAGGIRVTNTSITNFRRNIYAYVDRAIRYSEPVNISTKTGNAVLVSEEDWRSMQETMYLHSVPGLVDSILDASQEKTEDMIVYDPNEEW